MNQKIAHFFEKHGITPGDIKYIIREEGQTVIYTIDDQQIHTYHPVKEFKESLSREDFLHPNKGILLAASQIVDVSGGAYTLADGRKFRYRVHNSQLHDSRMLQLGRKLESMQAVADALPPDTFQTRFSVLDKLPLGASLIELVYDEHGGGADFIVRYINEKMAQLQNGRPEDFLNRSCMDFYSHVAPKWQVILADVALNDTVRIIEDYHSRIGVRTRIYCYQPMEGFCLCIMIEGDKPNLANEIHSIML